MLNAAILRALSNVSPGFMGVDPHAVGPVGNQVGLPCQHRDPETVVGVGREQRDVRGRGLFGITDWNVQLIGSYEPLLRILKLPPELVANRGYLDGVRREPGVL